VGRKHALGDEPEMARSKTSIAVRATIIPSLIVLCRCIRGHLPVIALPPMTAGPQRWFIATDTMDGFRYLAPRQSRSTVFFFVALLDSTKGQTPRVTRSPRPGLSKLDRRDRDCPHVLADDAAALGEIDGGSRLPDRASLGPTRPTHGIEVERLERPSSCSSPTTPTPPSTLRCGWSNRPGSRK